MLDFLTIARRSAVLAGLFCVFLLPFSYVGAQDFTFEDDEEMEVSPLDTGREMIEYPVVKLRSLDKITARTVTFEAEVGSTLKFGPIFIKVQACRGASPLDEPESAAFLQVWEVTPEQEAQWIFSGWMFASSPGLSAMDHPIYDVWVLDCQERVSGASVAEDGALEEDEGVVETAPVKPDEVE